MAAVLINNGIDSWPHGYRVIVRSLDCSYEELLTIAKSFRDDGTRFTAEETARDWYSRPTPIITRVAPDRYFTGYVKTPLGDVEYRYFGKRMRLEGVGLDREGPEYGWRGRH